jgi:outer membrane biosynthesis protein TonB
MRTASAISTGLHAAVLLWALVSFSGKTFEVTPAESLPVDLVSEKDFTEMTKGAKQAPKLEMPKPLVDKIDAPKPADDLVAKLTEKKDLKAVAEKTPEPQPQTKPDPIAEKLKKQDEQKQQAKAEPLPPKKPPQKEQPKFDADKIAALLDKRDPQRNAATGAELNPLPSLGTATGNAAKLSQSEIDALRARLMSLWNPPIGIQNPEEFVIRIRIQLGRDGKLSAPPTVLSTGNGPLYNSARDSAVRAVFQGQPFNMLKPDHYETWKDIEVTFDPRDMFRG